MADSVYFGWRTARAAGTTGNRVRRAAWTTQWLTFYNGLWWIVPDVPGGFLKRVVTSDDFGLDEFTSQDWTNLSVGCVSASPAVIGGGAAKCPVIFDPAAPKGFLPVYGASQVPPI